MCFFVSFQPIDEEKKRTYIETRSEDEDVKALLSDYYMAHPDEAQATVLPISTGGGSANKNLAEDKRSVHD